MITFKEKKSIFFIENESNRAVAHKNIMIPNGETVVKNNIHFSKWAGLW